MAATRTREKRRAPRQRRLSGAERRRLALLGLPTFGMALTITAVSTYLPVVARGFHASATAIGLIIGAEGLMALWVPLLVGAWSDRLRTPIGPRLPFVLAGTPVMVLCLVVVGFAGSLAAMAVVVAVYFAGYFVAYGPYRALYPDLVGSEQAGRSQSVQAAWRGLGTGIALLSGGALLSVAKFLPFSAYALLLAVSVGVFARLLLAQGIRDPAKPAGSAGARRAFADALRLLRSRPALRSYFLANALWELSLGAIKTFVVLYVTAGLGFSLGSASLIIGGVAMVVLVGALASGKLGDRYGRPRVAEAGLWVYGLTLLVPGLTTAPAAILAAMPFVALGGGMLMSLPFSLLMPLMREAEHGVSTGLYSLSRGLGVMLGPLLAGLAIQLAGPLLPAAGGYAVAWLVAAAAVLFSIPLLRAMRARSAA